MLRFSNVLFNTPDDSGAAPAEPIEAEPAPAPEPVDSGAAPAEPIEAEPAPAPEPVDWNARVQEWGGEEEITAAVELHQALRTREGVEALFREAGRALGFGDAAIKSLFGGEDPSTAVSDEPTVEELLADPDRILTAGEVARILEHQQAQARQQTEAQTHAQQVAGAIDSAFESLGLADEDDRIAVLTLADQLLPEHQQGDLAAIDRAIRTAHERYQAKVRAAAEAIVQQRHETHQQLPTPLPAGAGTAGTPVIEEPKSVEEAKQRARQSLGLS